MRQNAKAACSLGIRVAAMLTFGLRAVAFSKPPACQAQNEKMES